MIGRIIKLFRIIMEIFGLVKQAEDVIQDKPIANPSPATSLKPGQPIDETDRKNEYHLNQ